MRKTLDLGRRIELHAMDAHCRNICNTMHERALKRAFLDLCKLETDTPLAPKPLTVFDKKADGNLIARSLGDGVYEMGSDPLTPVGAKRAAVLARGFAKLCEMDFVEGGNPRVAFGCRRNHDAMIGMLMYRAQNIRATMQEEEGAAARGILCAPSSQ